VRAWTAWLPTSSDRRLQSPESGVVPPRQLTAAAGAPARSHLQSLPASGAFPCPMPNTPGWLVYTLREMLKTPSENPVPCCLSPAVPTPGVVSASASVTVLVEIHREPAMPTPKRPSATAPFASHQSEGAMSVWGKSKSAGLARHPRHCPDFKPTAQTIREFLAPIWQLREGPPRDSPRWDCAAPPLRGRQAFR
jgi:hypothetical protein